MTEDRYLSVQDLAERYGVAVQTVYHWNHQRRGPRYTKAGRFPRYSLRDVLAWEAANAVETGGPEAA